LKMSEDTSQRTTNISGLFTQLVQISAGSNNEAEETPLNLNEATDQDLFNALFENYSQLSQRGRRALTALHIRMERRREQYQQQVRRRRKKTLPQRVMQKVYKRVPYPVVEKFTNFVVGQCNLNKIGQFSPLNAARILIYFMSYGTSLEELQWETGLTKSKARDLFIKLRSYIKEFVQSNFKVNSLQERREVAAERVPPSYEVDLQDISAIIDGVHFKIQAPSTHPHFYDPNIPFWSYKERHAAVTVQAITDVKGYFLWKSSSAPAAMHDFPHTLKNVGRIEQSGLGDDTIGADLGYVGQIDLNIALPYKKPPNQELTQEQINYNRRFSRIRSEIERSFGLLKKRFALFRYFRIDLSLFDDLLSLAIVLTNEIKNISVQSPYLEGSISDSEWREIDSNFMGDVDDMPLHEHWESVRSTVEEQHSMIPTNIQLSLSQYEDEENDEEEEEEEEEEGNENE